MNAWRERRRQIEGQRFNSTPKGPRQPRLKPILWGGDRIASRALKLLGLWGPGTARARDLRHRELNVFLPTLPAAFEGYSILHLSDLHPDTLDGLAQRRRRMNPRLDIEWLRYLVTVGGREDADGWRWKLDPAMRFGGFGPWRPQWSVARMAGLSAPFLGIIGVEPEEMGWRTTAADVDGLLPADSEFHSIATGHFVHIEQPDEVSSLVLDFLERRVVAAAA